MGLWHWTSAILYAIITLTLLFIFPGVRKQNKQNFSLECCVGKKFPVSAVTRCTNKLCVFGSPGTTCPSSSPWPSSTWVLRCSSSCPPTSPLTRSSRRPARQKWVAACYACYTVLLQRCGSAMIGFPSYQPSMLHKSLFTLCWAPLRSFAWKHKGGLYALHVKRYFLGAEFNP